MATKSSARLAAALVAVGGALVGVASAQSQLNTVLRFSAATYTTGAVIGATALCLGGALAVSEYVRMPQRGTYVCAPAQSNHLAMLRKFAGGIIDAELLSVQALGAWQKQRPDCHQLIFKVRKTSFRKTSELVGFFTVVPVTAEAQQELEKNELRGFRIEPRHIVPIGDRPAALYVGAVGAKGYRGKQYTLMALKGFLSAAAMEVAQIYTRPVTKDGLRLALQHGFKPVSREQKPQETVFVKAVQRGTALLQSQPVRPAPTTEMPNQQSGSPSRDSE